MEIILGSFFWSMLWIESTISGYVFFLNGDSGTQN